jgi:maltoporin
MLLAGFLSTRAFAQEPAQAGTQQPTSEATAAPALTPPAAAATAVAPAGAAAAVAPSAPAPAPTPKFGDVSTSGYFRGGFGGSSQKGRMTCFGLSSINGSLKSKYRLGNECEQWGELMLSTVVYAGEDGVVGTFHFRPVAFIPTTYIGFSPSMTTSAQDQQGQSSTGATVAFPDLYADLKGISWLYGGTAWAGSRYYKRESVYISDFFYWNPSGVGAGIEDAFQIGKIWMSAPRMLQDLSFSYAAFAVDGEPTGNPYLPQIYALGVRNDLQVRGFRPWRSGELRVGFQYIADWSRATDDTGNPVTTHGGWGGTLQFVQRWLGGDTKLAVQYGRGGGTGFGTLARFYYPDFSLNQDTSESRLRVVVVPTIQPWDWLGAQAVFVFQRDNNQTPSAGDWYSAGARVSLGVIKHAKLLGEAGNDTVAPTNGSGRRTLTKLTGAVAITADRGFLARPELRLFYTWATWNVDARTAHIDSGDIYLNTNLLSGAVFGLQAETWW